MAYRRRYTMPRSTTFEDSAPSSAPFSAYGRSASFSSSSSSSSAYQNYRRRRLSQDSNTYEYTSIKNLNEANRGFWGSFTRRAKAIIDEDTASLKTEGQYNQPQMLDSRNSQFHSRLSSENYQRQERPTSLERSDVETGSPIKNGFEEGQTIVGHMTADIQEARKLQIRRKHETFDTEIQSTEAPVAANLSHNQADYEVQLKASRDVRLQM